MGTGFVDANGEYSVSTSPPKRRQRLETWKAEESQYNRGYYKLYIDSVLQADQGADAIFGGHLDPYSEIH